MDNLIALEHFGALWSTLECSCAFCYAIQMLMCWTWGTCHFTQTTTKDIAIVCPSDLTWKRDGNTPSTSKKWQPGDTWPLPSQMDTRKKCERRPRSFCVKIAVCSIRYLGTQTLLEYVYMVKFQSQDIWRLLTLECQYCHCLCHVLHFETFNVLYCCMQTPHKLVNFRALFSISNL